MSLWLGFIVGIGAQIYITSNYNKYKKQAILKNITGFDAARMILDANGLQNIYIVKTNGELTDHYDPNKKVIKLSNDIYNGNSIAAVSVAAHECGHAIQDKENYSFLKVRTALVPFVNLVSYLGYIGLIISFFVGIIGYIKISILVLLVTILFQIVTLPVEFDASKRAKEQLKLLDIVTDVELEGSNKMLFAAALTYVAGLFSNLLQLLRLVLLLGLHDRD